MKLLQRLRMLQMLFVALLVATTYFALPSTPTEARAGGGSSYRSTNSTRSSGKTYSSGSTSTSTYSTPSYSYSTHRSYSTTSTSTSSSSSSSSGGGGGGVVLVVFLIILIIIIVMIVKAKQKDATEWRAEDDGAPQSDTYLPLSEAVAKIKALDPAFSETLFSDFTHLLYTQVQVERGKGNLEAFTSYIEQAIIDDLSKDARARQVKAVDEVLVGSSKITAIEVEGSAPYIGIQVEIEANFTEHYPTDARRIFTRERWSLRRKRGVKSKGPKDMSALSCPSCGAPSEPRPDGSCPYCDTKVKAGDAQWMLSGRKLLELNTERQLDLTASADEEGTDEPDVIADDYEASRQGFLSRNADFDGAAFEERVKACFMGIQTAWSSGRWEAARPFESDHLFNTHRYWIDQYQRQGLTNKLDDIQVTRIQPVRFAQDAYYDTITVRIHASLKDYVVDRDGKVVGGSPRSDRAFSEYWTFLRSKGSERAAKIAESGCPNCGAPLQITMAGACEYCGSKLTSGKFDWVLAAIEQDDTYGKEDVALLEGYTPAPPAPPES